MNKNIVYLKFDQNWFNKKELLQTAEGIKLKVLETPHKKWWKQFFQFITFGLYKSPTHYKCKIIEDK